MEIASKTSTNKLAKTPRWWQRHHLGCRRFEQVIMLFSFACNNLENYKMIFGLLFSEIKVLWIHDWFQYYFIILSMSHLFEGNIRFLNGLQIEEINTHETSTTYKNLHEFYKFSLDREVSILSPTLMCVAMHNLSQHIFVRFSAQLNFINSEIYSKKQTNKQTKQNKNKTKNKKSLQQFDQSFCK